MRLWTIQPESVWESLQATGVFICNPNDPEVCPWVDKYMWLAEQMEMRIGRRPEGVILPIWAWSAKPDLRRERFDNGYYGDKFVCLEIEVPKEEVVLTDFDDWSIILLNGLLTCTKEEDDHLNAIYDSLSPKEQTEFKTQNWQRVFDTTTIAKTDWYSRGTLIQATFWVLRIDQVCKVRHFTSASRLTREAVNEQLRNAGCDDPKLFAS